MMDISVNQRKEFIILTAIDLIHENGIHNVSTKEIARRLRISESLIFKLFPKKVDIFTSILEHFAFYDKAIFNSAIEKNDDSIETILFYINSFLTYYENYPAITAVFQVYDSLKGEPELEAKSKEIFQTRLEYMQTMVLRAQATGRIEKEFEPESIADTITSIVRGMCLKWRITDFSFSLKEKTIYAINMLLKAIEIPKQVS